MLLGNKNSQSVSDRCRIPMKDDVMKNKKAARNFVESFDEIYKRRVRRISMLKQAFGWTLLAAACVFASGAYVAT
jgi:hypothetical protein